MALRRNISGTKIQIMKMDDKVYPVISLGWGVQSFALAAMSGLGILPKVAAAIHADIRFEKSATYEFAKKWTPWLEEHGVKVVTVRQESGWARWHGKRLPRWKRINRAPTGTFCK